MLSTAWVRFSRSSKLVIRPTISCAPFTHKAACWLNRSKNLPSVGIRRPNMLFSVGESWNLKGRGTGHAAVIIGLVALVNGEVAAVIAELGVHAHPGQSHGADRAVTLFADNDLGGTFVGRVRVIDFVAVQENDDVRVLLDS